MIRNTVCNDSLLWGRKMGQLTLLTVMLAMCTVSQVLATHNLAGQITCERVVGGPANTYAIRLTTYTDPAPAGVDRCSANIEIWSSNGILIIEMKDIPRSNGGPLPPPIPTDCNILNPLNGVPVYGTVKENFYDTVYTFPGPGNYELRYFDVARLENVANMIDPGSTAFYVETLLSIPNPIIGDNNTPILLNRPLDEACVGKLWTHNPGGLDLDGDSLVYSLRPSFQYEPGMSIPPSPVNGYQFPDSSTFGTSTFTMDPFTGLIIWDVPPQLGIFNIAFEVREYRNGVLLGYVIRDMAIFVKDCDNNPPVIESIMDTCVVAGETLEFDVTAYDPDFEDSVYLQLNNSSIGNNGPFFVTPNTATINGEIIDQLTGSTFFNSLPVSTLNNETTIDTIEGTVTWDVLCDNIRTQKYQVDFFANDNFSYISESNNTQLTANHIVQIKVIPPPPLNLTTTVAARQVFLDWDPTACENAMGYNVYRQTGPAGMMQDTICCENSPASAGYDLIAYVQGWGNTDFTDTLSNISNPDGEDICYVITAIYQDEISFQFIESCATDTSCIEIESDPIYITNDSISVTDPVNGEIFISWSQPDSVDAAFPRPFTYRLYRANNNQFPAIPVTTQAFDDTTFTDTQLDTEGRGYNYRVELLDSAGIVIPASFGTNIASSIYLITAGGNNLVSLEWAEYVAWENTEYEIYRSENGSPFNLLETLPRVNQNIHTYVDTGLNPNSEYCYFIRSYGSHNAPNVKPLLINDSQVSCSFAQDDEPPCNPTMDARGDCETLTHQVSIVKPQDPCALDADSIHILFANNPVGPFFQVRALAYESFGTDTTLIISFAEDTKSFAGCYAVTVTDTIGNTSELSPAVCIDYCPDLVLGNIFTPNGDGINDVFTPVFYRDVVLREIKIFDRWGNLMSTNTTDIVNLWDGRIGGSGKEAKPGVYYYFIKYEYLGLNGNTMSTAKGWVTLMR